MKLIKECAGPLTDDPWVSQEQHSVSLGDMESCLSKKTGKTKKELFGSSLPTLEKNCSNGSASACTAAGMMYVNGIKVEANAEQGVILLATGCGAGDMQACQLLGVLHLQGQGVAKDYNKAISYSERACSGGLAHGCWQLGRFYMNGQKGYVRAKEAFLEACDLRYQNGCADYGAMIVLGHGGEKNPAKGYALLEKACAAGADIDNCNSEKKKTSSGTTKAS